MASTSTVTINRSSYIQNRFMEFVVKRAVRHAARHRSAFGRFAVVPTEYVGSNVIANGLYERHQLTLIHDLILKQSLGDTLALDIGANIGNHTIVFSKWFRDVIAFEPNPPVATLLEANILLSGAKNVQVKRVGLGAVDALMPFTPDSEGNDGHGSFAVESGKTIDLQVRNGDQFLAEIDPNIANGTRKIGFIKCDVEGFEPSVFRGLKNTLTRQSPMIVFESDHKGPGVEAFSVLQEAGYKFLYAIRETGDDSRGQVQREFKRLFSTYQFWIQPLDAIPGYWSNLIATKTPLL